MPTTWTAAELNTRTDAVATRIVAVGLHTGDPGAAGTLLEATGGTPAYARLSPAWEPAGDVGVIPAQVATDGIAWGYVEFDVPAGSYSYLSYWATGDVYLGCRDFTTQTTVAQDIVKCSIPLNANP